MAAKKSVVGEVVTFEEADRRLKKALTRCFMGEYESVLFIAGDLELKGDFLPALKKLYPRAKYEVVAIAGSLTVKGRLAIADQTPGLFVKGKTHAETIEGGDCEMHLHGGSAKYFVYGYHNHGLLYAGKVTTPWLIESDQHDFEISTGKALTVDNNGSYDSFDFNAKNIAAAFVPAVVKNNALNVDAFYAHLRSKKPVLVKGAKTIKQIRKAEVDATATSHETTLDLTDKKVTSFPKHLLKMPWLKTLVLDKNRVGKVPKEIDRLVNLETLSLKFCSVGALPESLGSLKSLRELRFAGTDFVLPKSIGKLPNLETIVLSHACGDVVQVDGWSVFEPWQIPEALGRAKKLRRVIGSYASLAAPKSFRGKTSIEEVKIPGGDARYLRHFPDWVTQLPNLKRLDLSDNYFPTIPSAVEGLKNLEYFNLSRSLTCLDKLPDFSQLPKLRELNLSGGCSHSRFQKPPHERLRPLFSMRLDSLEKLHIDRWGKEDDYRAALTAKDLEGIGGFQHLTWLDLSVNGLTELPADFFELKGLKWLDLQYNAFSREQQERIAAAYPTTSIDFRDIDDGVKKPPKTKAAELVGNAECASYYGRDDDALRDFKQALKGVTSKEHHVLVAAHLGLFALHRKLANEPKRAADKREASRLESIKHAEAIVKLAPDAWKLVHITAESFGLRSAFSTAANAIAMAALDDQQASTETIARAKTLIDQAAQCVDSQNAASVQQTQARVTEACGRMGAVGGAAIGSRRGFFMASSAS